TVSRAHRDLLRRLLELEVPEIYNGVVEVKSIAREPGFRSKVAVAALQPGVDPVGSCVGMRGVRIQNIVNELGGEKIDVVAWSSDERTFIANALSPAKVVAVYLNPLEKAAKVIVPDHALSLAIGKEGQNARLAAKLTGWRIDIKSESEAAAEADQLKAEMEEAMRRVRELEEARRAAAELLAQAQASLEEEADLDQEGSLEEEAPAAVEEPEILAEGPSSLVEEVEETASVVEEAEMDSALEAEPALAFDLDTVSAPVTSQVEDQEKVEDVFEEEFVEEEDEFEEEEDEDRPSRGRKAKRRGRYLEYDDRAGRLVIRKQRKRNRRQDWDLWEEE
ncbi:MAG: transcription termination/antitermination protein NusA, partial [Chloroflexi bacterium]|nr:transcription termination/antitermination protein NusA [Chloroflexota bacterium]